MSNVGTMMMSDLLASAPVSGFGSIGMIKIISLGVFIFISGIMTLTASSMGISCYNQNSSYKNQRGGSFSFLIMTLIMGIVMILGGIALIVFRIYVKYRVASMF